MPFWLPLAAAPGFDAGGLYAGALLFVGLAIFAAVGALSHERDRAFSASLIYLALGVGAAAVIGIFDIRWLRPVEDAWLIERLAELAVIVALFSTGLKLDRPLEFRTWGSVARLLLIVMPLSTPGIIATAIYSFIGAWNEYIFAYTFLNKNDQLTLPVGIQRFFSENTTDFPGLMAASFMMSLPVVVLFLLLQRFFVRALTEGAVKH